MSAVSFRYFEHVRRFHRKFSRNRSEKIFSYNWRFCQNIPTSFWSSSFFKISFFYNSWHILWLMCCAIMIFLLERISALGVPFRHIEHARKVYRNVSRTFEKRLISKREILSEYSNLILRSFFLLVLNWNFLSKPLENILWTLRACSRYLGCPTNLEFCVS